MQYKRDPQRWVAIIYCYEHPPCSSSSFSTNSAQAPSAAVCSGGARYPRAAAFGACAAVRCAGSYHSAGKAGRAHAPFFTCSSLVISGDDYSSDASGRTRCPCSSFVCAAPGSSDSAGTHHPIGTTGDGGTRSAHTSSRGRRTAGIFAASSGHTCSKCRCTRSKCGHTYHFHADCNSAYGGTRSLGSWGICAC